MKQMGKLFLSLLVFLIFVFPLLGEDATEPISHSDYSDNSCIGLGMFANLGSSVQFIDPATMTLSPQYLRGQLGPYGSLLDLVITPDGNTAIASNFDDANLYFLDISGGFSVEPTILGKVKIPFFAEDIAVTPNGKYALITDGIFGQRIAVVDIPNMSFVMVRKIPFEKSVQAVTVASDGVTVVATDFWVGEIHTLLLEEDGWLTYKMSIRIGNTWPVNVAVSPDGKTALITASYLPHVVVCWISEPGNLAFINYLPLPTRSMQSVVFSADGRKAYVNSNDIPWTSNQIHVLDVNGPGNVSYSGVSMEIPAFVGDGGLFGVDTLAIDPSGSYLYATNPTDIGCQTVVHVLDLKTETYLMPLKAQGIPAGIAFTCQPLDAGVNEHPNNEQSNGQ